MTLTASQQAVWHYLRQYLRTYGEAPTLRRIARATRLPSSGVAAQHLDTLHQLGLITRSPGYTDIAVTEQP